MLVTLIAVMLVAAQPSQSDECRVTLGRNNGVKVEHCLIEEDGNGDLFIAPQGKIKAPDSYDPGSRSR